MVSRTSCGLAGVAFALIAACATTPPALQPPTEVASAGAVVPPLASASVASSPAPPSTAGPPPKPSDPTMLGADPGSRFSTRAWLRREASLVVRYGDTESLREEPPLGHLGPTFPAQVVVVDQHEGDVRFALERPWMLLLLWGSADAFERVPVVRTRLLDGPRAVTQSPPDGTESAGSGLWVRPGLRVHPLRGEGTFVEVEVNEGAFRGSGWLDPSRFGAVYEKLPTEISVPTPAIVGRGTRLTLSKAMLGEFISEATVEVIGPGPRGFTQVRYASFGFVAEGLVPEDEVRRLPAHKGAGRGSFSSSTMGAAKASGTLTVSAGAQLYDGPRGEQVGVLRQKVSVEPEPGSEQGRRRIAVPTFGLGMARVWVDEQALAPAVSRVPGAK